MQTQTRGVGIQVRFVAFPLHAGLAPLHALRVHFRPPSLPPPQLTGEGPGGPAARGPPRAGTHSVFPVEIFSCRDLCPNPPNHGSFLLWLHLLEDSDRCCFARHGHIRWKPNTMVLTVTAQRCSWTQRVDVVFDHASWTHFLS